MVMINTIASGVSGAIELNKKGRKEHPCVYMTVADVESARELMETQVWARNYADNVIAAADEAMAKSDGWYLICKTDWGTWGDARCSRDIPGRVTCDNGHVLPDAEHPDSGEGYIDPDDRVHY